MVEVGSWTGGSALQFASKLQQLGSGNKLVCIDTWLGAPEFYTSGLEDSLRGLALRRSYGWPHVYYTFLSNVFARGVQDVVVPFPINSLQGAHVLNHYGLLADAIFIDASHEELPALADMRAFWPLLTPGGILFGDDYRPRSWPGVARAVDRFSKDVRVAKQVHDATWFIRKPPLIGKAAGGR